MLAERFADNGTLPDGGDAPKLEIIRDGNVAKDNTDPTLVPLVLLASAQK